MARVTVEDCIEHIPNRFELVLIAAQRAKQISSGTPLTIDRDNDKDSVVSLREIADQTIDLAQIKETLIQSFYKKPVADMDDKKLLTGGEEIAADVEEAFKDAAASVTTPLVAEDEMEEEGLSFADDNIETED